jgi:preprotein translocase SecE subunit
VADKDKAKEKSQKKTESVKKQTVKDLIQKDKIKNSSQKNNNKTTAKSLKTAAKEQKKSHKPRLLKKIFHVIGIILLPRYFRYSWQELKLVSWPNFKLSRQLTLAVIIFAVFFGVSIYYLDNGLGDVFKYILLK